MIEYRGYGGSSGEPDLVSMLDYGQAVLKVLCIAPAVVVAYGRSIGSLFAIELSRRCPHLAGMVIDSGIADIQERFLAQPRIREVLEGLGHTEVEAEMGRYFDHQAK